MDELITLTEKPSALGARMFRIQSVRPAVKKEKHEAGAPVAG